MLVFGNFCNGQDFFEDLKANGTPILEAGNGSTLLTPRLTPSDGSIKINFFKWMGNKLDTTSAEIQEIEFGMNNQNSTRALGTSCQSGFGLNLKARSADGLSSVFKTGSFANGITLGGYKAFARLHKGTKAKLTSEMTYQIISANLSANSYRFFRPDQVVSDQLTDFKTYGGFSASYSFLRKMSSGKNKRGNLFLGGSITFSRSDNYSSLNKVEVKRSSTYPIPGDKQLQVATTIDDEGYTYATIDSGSSFKKPFFFQLRAHVTLIPDIAERRIAFIVYPELVHEIDAKTKLNGNLAFHFLKEGEPGTSILGIFLTFIDLTNSTSKSQPFLKRSLVVGVTTAWDMLLGK
jgi:hypothetical protein